MALQFECAQVIDRPIDKVFHFFAVEPVRNRPRWDSDIDLWLDSDARIDVSTIIRGRNKRSGTSVEGTIEIVELGQDRVFATDRHDGPAFMHGGVTFEAINEYLRRQFETGRGHHRSGQSLFGSSPWRPERAKPFGLEGSLARAGV